MSIKKIVLGIAAAALTIASSPALSKNRYMGGLEMTEQHTHIPPVGFTASRWTHPNGCKYTRAGRPGETVWYLIINSVEGRDCVRFVVETAYPGMTIADYYGRAYERPSVTRTLFSYDGPKKSLSLRRLFGRGS